MVFIRGKQKVLFSHSLVLYWRVCSLAVWREEMQQEKGYWGPVVNWSHSVEAISCRLSDFTSFPTVVACLLFLKSASCYPLNLFICLLYKVASLVSSCVLWHFLMFWCFLLRYYPKRWVTHGKRALWSARKGLWAVWRVLFLQEGLGSHCGRWSDPEVLLRGASVVESPHKDQCKFPLHQSAAHHGVGTGRHSTLLRPTTPEVCLLPSNLMV